MRHLSVTLPERHAFLSRPHLCLVLRVPAFRTVPLVVGHLILMILQDLGCAYSFQHDETRLQTIMALFPHVLRRGGIKVPPVVIATCEAPFSFASDSRAAPRPQNQHMVVPRLD